MIRKSYKQKGMRKIDRRTIGRLPSRYAFALNPYTDVRFSRCPTCHKLTSYRKFPLLIHLEGIGLRVLGKTCRYCPRCELIITHKTELETELARIVSSPTSEITDDSYLVIGTVNLKTWQRALQTPLPINHILDQTADFKRYSKFTPMKASLTTATVHDSK